MYRTNIRKKVNELVKKYETTDPFELCKYLGVDLEWDDLGKNIMGTRTLMTRIPGILLNGRNNKTEDFEVCCHELGHHCCGHNANVEFLKRDNRLFVSYGIEYEANCFMVELLLHGVNLAEYPSKQCLLDSCGVPSWAERYVDWDYLEETADFDSFDSYYQF